MCLAVPAKIVELNDCRATVSVSGALREVDVSLVEEPRLGDYVLIHAGFAIHKWDEQEVAELAAIRAGMGWAEIAEDSVTPVPSISAPKMKG